MLVLGFSVITNLSYAQALKENSEFAATCSGIITGNASINFALESSTEDELLDVITISTKYLWTAFREDNLEPEDLVPYSNLHSENTDLMINHYNNETWDSEVYENVILCWTALSVFMHGREDIIDYDSARQSATTQVEGIKGVFEIE